MALGREDLTVGQTVMHKSDGEGVVEVVGHFMVLVSKPPFVDDGPRRTYDWNISDLVAPEPPKAKPGQRYHVAGFTYGALGLVDGRIIYLAATPHGPHPFNPATMTEWPYEDEK